MKISDKILKYLKDNGVKKGWLANYLGISRPTLNSRLEDNSFTVEEIILIKKLGIV